MRIEGSRSRMRPRRRAWIPSIVPIQGRWAAAPAGVISFRRLQAKLCLDTCSPCGGDMPDHMGGTCCAAMTCRLAGVDADGTFRLLRLLPLRPPIPCRSKRMLEGAMDAVLERAPRSLDALIPLAPRPLKAGGDVRIPIFFSGSRRRSCRPEISRHGHVRRHAARVPPRPSGPSSRKMMKFAVLGATSFHPCRVRRVSPISAPLRLIPLIPQRRFPANRHLVGQS